MHLLSTICLRNSGPFLQRHSRAEQYMFEEDYIYISSGLILYRPLHAKLARARLRLQTPLACSVPGDAASGTAFFHSTGLRLGGAGVVRLI